MMKPIAIHAREGSFSDEWIGYCKANGIDFRIVDCHQPDIVRQLEGCRALMWHFVHHRLDDMLIARPIIHSLETLGIRVFPDIRTCWHFDDKLAQKYLLDAIGAPCVPSHVFVHKQDALDWVERVEFPTVFKLRSGAGSSNVQLVRNKAAARHLIHKAFSSGFAAVPRWQPLQERWWQFRRDRTLTSLLNVSRGIARAVLPNPTRKRLPRQFGYVYFQEFIPDNDSDVRVIVIGKRAFAIKRMVRDGDFRASGSGRIVYEPDAIPESCIQIAFALADRLQTQSIALDFVFLRGSPLIVELSYAFMSSGYTPCPGYWTPDLAWIEGSFVPEHFMIEDLLSSLRRESACI